VVEGKQRAKHELSLQMTELADSLQRKGRAEKGAEKRNGGEKVRHSAQHVGAALLRYDRLVVR
jgi:hypothetical protein